MISLADNRPQILSLLLADPLLGALDAIDHVVLVLMQKTGPLLVSRQIGCIPDNDQAVLGSCYCHINTVVLLNKVAWLRPDHSDKDNVKLTTL